MGGKEGKRLGQDSMELHGFDMTFWRWKLEWWVSGMTNLRNLECTPLKTNMTVEYHGISPSFLGDTSSNGWVFLSHVSFQGCNSSQCCGLVREVPGEFWAFQLGEWLFQYLPNPPNCQHPHDSTKSEIQLLLYSRALCQIQPLSAKEAVALGLRSRFFGLCSAVAWSRWAGNGQWNFAKLETNRIDWLFVEGVERI